jgi:hypothetical protein
MIGRSKMNERLHEITPEGMLLDISVSPKKKKNSYLYIFQKLRPFMILNLLPVDTGYVLKIT